jgi:hypothetical protein
MISEAAMHHPNKVAKSLNLEQYEKKAMLDSLRLKVSKYIGSLFSNTFRAYVQNTILVKTQRKTNFSNKTIINLFSRILYQARQYQQDPKNTTQLTIEQTLKACTKISKNLFKIYSKFIDPSLIPNWNIPKIENHLINQFEPNFLKKKIANVTGLEIKEIISMLTIICNNEIYKNKIKKTKTKQPVIITSPIIPILPISPKAQDEEMPGVIRRDVFVGYCA